MPKTRQDLLDCLDALEITHSTVDHAPVFTVAESQSLRDEIPGGHTKNLFLKDKKGAYFLVTLEENAEVNLKTIHTLIGASGRVSFGKTGSTYGEARRDAGLGHNLLRDQ
jgi:Ala-tRNA(Pro) deacylase